ncbi:LANO_0D08460g1_1 [Lachancea nothofagi CBS 11611]|uniref:LANO_0D08460g1_1 n=1 Tax=Lachancea nothofagi CBS 11611 TaxID=1266666 RepID=A0A1G4JIZ4_9SACH|nr:LANO_0D08460g1_1 [Lachancea nothofagi CBS 11611]
MENKSSIDSEDVRKRLLEDSLSFNREKMVILNADPSSRAFVVWFMISSYFPVLTACLGPIANMIAVAGVVDKWRADEQGQIQPDPRGIYGVNVVSLILGCFSNFVLLLHFAKKVSYLTAQLINIVGWTMAGLMLLIDIVICGKRDYTPELEKTIGFWYAIFTVILYLSCNALLLIHYGGYKLGKYPATFNLTDSERNVMIFTFILSLWFIWGSAMFSQIVPLTYGEALYYCVVVVLTVGLGDLVPVTVAGKIMTLVYSLSGVIILGLIVALTRSIIQSSSGPIFFFYRVENARSKIYEELIASEQTMESETAFDIIKHVRSVSRMKQQSWSTFAVVCVFVAFWLLGALIFHYAEKWTYFNSLYFCFLCLITIGFGDFAPKTGCGRAFFVVWALCAVPLMTAMISTVGDTLYVMADGLDISIVRVSEWVVNLPQRLFHCLRASWSEKSIMPFSSEMSRVDEESIPTPYTSSEAQANADEQQRSLANAHSADGSSKTNVDPVSEKLEEYLKVVQWLRHLSRRDPNEKLAFDEWMQLFSSISDDTGKILDDPHFWLSNNSPLRYPFDERRYVMHTLLNKLEVDITGLLKKRTESEEK